MISAEARVAALYGRGSTKFAQAAAQLQQNVTAIDSPTSLAVASFCEEQHVDLVVVWPEAPLVSGVVDDLLEAGIPTFGPSAEAAALECSKTFMKRICDKHKIPTAKYGSFNNAEEAKEFIKEQGLLVVVKADRLAAGKGVIAETLEKAFGAVDAMLVDRTFGSAGGVVVLEEFLDGEEVSFFAIVDGETAIPLASAQDRKRVSDGDMGPNTRGVGADLPAPLLTTELQALVMDSIILPTVQGMEAEGCRLTGVLYAGIIVESQTGKPKLLEYNVRFGDPECQDIVAAGGRVLGVTALGRDVAEAQKQAYEVVDWIDWPQGFCRRDIGWRAVARQTASLSLQMKGEAF